MMATLRRRDARVGIVARVDAATRLATLVHEDGSESVGPYGRGRGAFPFPLTNAAAVPMDEGNLVFITGSRCATGQLFHEDFNRVPNTGRIQAFRQFDETWLVDTAASVGTNCQSVSLSGAGGAVLLTVPPGGGNQARLSKHDDAVSFDTEYSLEDEALYLRVRHRLPDVSALSAAEETGVEFGFDGGGALTGPPLAFFARPNFFADDLWHIADGGGGYVLTNHPYTDTEGVWQTFEAVRVGTLFNAVWIDGMGPYYVPVYEQAPADAGYGVFLQVDNGNVNANAPGVTGYWDEVALVRLGQVAEAQFVREIAQPGIEEAAA